MSSVYLKHNDVMFFTYLAKSSISVHTEYGSPVNYKNRHVTYWNPEEKIQVWKKRKWYYYKLAATQNVGLLVDWNESLEDANLLLNCFMGECLLGEGAGLTDDNFPFDIMYTEQKSGTIFKTDVGTSACLKALSIKKMS